MNRRVLSRLSVRSLVGVSHGTVPAPLRSGPTRGLPARSASVAAVVALLLSIPLATSATASDTDSKEGWGPWHGLDEGYIGRRRVPPKIDQEVEERRSDDTAPRHSKLRREAKRLREDLLEGKRSGEDKVERRDKTDRRGGSTQLSSAETTATPGAAVLLEALTTTEPVTAAWLRTGPAGLYAVSVADLALGMSQSERTIRSRARRGTLALTTGGEFKAWYFDRAADALLFAGEAYETFYTDENAHRLSFARVGARQMVVTTTTPTQAASDERPFRDTLHFEEEKGCESCLKYDTVTVASEPDADYWFWDYLWGGFRDQIDVALQVPSPAPSGAAQLRVRLRGWTDLEAGDEHRVRAELNGTAVGSILIWDGLSEVVLVADFDQGLLRATGSNTLTLRNEYDDGTHPGEYLDDIAIDYDRMPVAFRSDDSLPDDIVMPREIEGALWLDDVSPGVQTVTGFASAEILVVESPTGSAVLRQDARVESDGAGGWQVTFEVDSAADYLVVERGSLGTTAIAPDYPVAPSLASRKNEADYLIIAPPEFVETAGALAVYRDFDFDEIKVVKLDDIYDEFSFGREDPKAITRFMEQVRRWNRVPSVVTLVGKGSLDHKDRMGYGDSFLPIVLTDTPWELAPSDDRLLGGGGDAPFAIGRLPITNNAEGVAYVEKLSAYEAIGPAPGRRGVLAADNPDDGGDFHTNSDLLAERLLGLGFAQMTRLYHPDDPVSSILADSATWETEYVSYDGHGSYAQVGNGTENFITTASAEALTNNVLPLFTALTCAAGNDANPGVRSLAGALVLNPAGGAVAAVAPTGLSLDAEAQTLGNAFVDRLFDPAESDTIGAAIGGAKADTAGEISAFMGRIYGVVGEPAVRAR